MNIHRSAPKGGHNALGRHCANRAPLRGQGATHQKGALKTSHIPAASINRVMSPMFTPVLMSEADAADAATAAQQVSIPGDGNVPIGVTVEPELSLGELTQVWTLGVGSDRSLGRPKE